MNSITFAKNELRFISPVRIFMQPHRRSLLDVKPFTETYICGLKARATLASGNAPGHNRPTIGGLKARAKCRIRNSQLHESSPTPQIFFPHFQPKNRMSSPKTT